MSSRRITLMVLSLLIAGSYLGTGWAQEVTPPAAQAPAPAPAEKPADKAPDTGMKKTRSQRISGIVTAVDAAGKTVTVKTKKQEVTLNLSEKTKVTSGKEKKDLADLKAGDKVTAFASDEGGKLTAKAIRMAAPKKSAAPAPAAPAPPAEQPAPSAPGTEAK